MPDRATANRMTAGRGVPRRPNVVQVRLQATSMFLRFDVLMGKRDVLKLLFRAGELPPGFELESEDRLVAETRWTLSWPQGAFPSNARLIELTDYGLQLWNRGIIPEISPEEVERRERERQAEIEVRRQDNRTWVPALGMTAAQAMSTLSAGLYVAAPGHGVHAVPALGPNAVFPPDVAWIRAYQLGGYFVWVGEGQGEKLLHMYALGYDDMTQFWREVVWLVQRQGYSLKYAVEDFCKRWDEHNRLILTAFIQALDQYRPSFGPRANVTAEDPYEGVLGGADRGIQRGSFSQGLASEIDPLEAAEVALAVVGQLTEPKPSDDDELEAEMDAIVNQAVADLQKRIASQPAKAYGRDLRTGEMGEAFVKATLKLRGFDVVELQNASGQGIDLIAIKVKGGVARLYVFEVKSSESDIPGRLSAAQSDPHAFYRSRLERVVAHEGLYKNVPQQTVEIARRMLGLIDEGHPVGAVRVDVHFAKTLAVKVRFRVWRPLARAVARAVKSTRPE